jgi:hypothetical protein
MQQETADPVENEADSKKPVMQSTHNKRLRTIQILPGNEERDVPDEFDAAKSGSVSLKPSS